MAKIEKRLNEFGNWVLGQSTWVNLGGEVSGEGGEKIKQALYTDMLELIGKDYPHQFWCNGGGENTCECGATPENRLRQELRTKLKEYYGISDEDKS